MRLKQVLTLALIAACGMGLVSCTAESKKTEQVMTQEKATYQKKYTNADFYKDGKFDQEAAKKAFLDMFELWCALHSADGERYLVYRFRFG